MLLTCLCVYQFNLECWCCCIPQLVSNPGQFDVMVMPNLYGNIVSNIGAALVGGAGVCPGKNIGTNFILFEQGARHTGLELAFQNRANPTAMLLSSTALLGHLGCVLENPMHFSC